MRFFAIFSQKAVKSFSHENNTFLTTGSGQFTTGSVFMKLIDFLKKSQKT